MLSVAICQRLHCRAQVVLVLETSADVILEERRSHNFITETDDWPDIEEYRQRQARSTERDYFEIARRLIALT